MIKNTSLLLALLCLSVFLSDCKKKDDQAPAPESSLCDMTALYRDSTYRLLPILDSIGRLKKIDLEYAGVNIGTYYSYFYDANNNISFIRVDTPADGLLEYTITYNANRKPTKMVKKKTTDMGIYYDSLLYDHSTPGKITIDSYTQSFIQIGGGPLVPFREKMKSLLELDANGNVVREYASVFTSKLYDTMPHPANRDTLILSTEYEYYADKKITVPYIYMAGFGEWGTVSTLLDENFFATNLLRTLHCYTYDYNSFTGITTSRRFESSDNIRYEFDNVGNITKMTYSFLNNIPGPTDKDYSVYYNYNCN